MKMDKNEREELEIVRAFVRAQATALVLMTQPGTTVVTSSRAQTDQKIREADRVLRSEKQPPTRPMTATLVRRLIERGENYDPATGEYRAPGLGTLLQSLATDAAAGKI